MHAQAGDWLVIETNHVGQHAKRGQIKEVHSQDGSPPFLVHWEDGHDALVFPGPDAHVVKQN